MRLHYSSFPYSCRHFFFQASRVQSWRGWTLNWFIFLNQGIPMGVCFKTCWMLNKFLAWAFLAGFRQNNREFRWKKTEFGGKKNKAEMEWGEIRCLRSFRQSLLNQIGIYHAGCPNTSSVYIVGDQMMFGILVRASAFPPGLGRKKTAYRRVGHFFPLSGASRYR